MMWPWKQYRCFYFLYSAILAVCSYFVLNFSKADIHLWLNQHYSAFFDVFFKYLTLLGDGITLPLFIVIMLFKKFRFSILIVVVFLLSGAVVQLLKHFAFDDYMRPLAYLGGTHPLHLVAGVKQYMHNSFPSGHSATAFGVFLCMAFLSKNNWYQGSMLFIACLVAYSRIYLSQHFLIDTMAGSLIGVLTAVLCYVWLFSYKATWLDKNIINCWPPKQTTHLQAKI